MHPHARPVALKTIGNWKWRWLTLGEASRYLWWTLHGGTTFLRKSNTFSHGWWNMNGGDTKLSEYAVYNLGWIISAWFSDFASFHPMSDSMTSSLLWRHRRASRALLVFWDNAMSYSFWDNFNLMLIKAWLNLVSLFPYIKLQFWHRDIFHSLLSHRMSFQMCTEITSGFTRKLLNTLFEEYRNCLGLSIIQPNQMPKFIFGVPPKRYQVE